MDFSADPAHDQTMAGNLENRHDVLIVGGGFVGGALGCALAGAGLSCLVIDHDDPSAQLDAGFDGRSSAIAAAPRRLLRRLGIWQHVEEKATPIEDIRVADGSSPFFLHYDHTDLGEEPLGHMVENRHLRQAVLASMKTVPRLHHLAPAEAVALDQGDSRVRLTLKDGRTVEAPLVIGCDGRGSWLRSAAEIPLTKWSYEQVGIVCTVRHERSHDNVAHEHFLPSGPFAILPLTDNRSSIVWTEKANLAPALLALPDNAFLEELSWRFGEFLGKLEVTGPRWSYPLSLQFAQRITDRRVALAGDAAQAMHPIAGQGLNLGLRDVAALAEVVVDARRLGLDIGAGKVLDRYASWRRFDSHLMLALTDGLNRLFSNDVAPVRVARDVGLAAVEHMAPLKAYLMRHAMGEAGSLPRLLKGEAL